MTRSTSQSEGSAPDPRQEEIDTAAAFLSIAGPCHAAGNVYLACVATAGLGMCRHLRANFEQCAKAQLDASRERLKIIGEQQCSPDETDKEICGARLVLRHYMPPRPSAP